MADNKQLHNAKAVKNDEFYTEYNTIANELGHYREQLIGQVVYCNCDDPAWSNFWKYFHSNFGSFKLKKLISTHYRKDSEPSYALVYEGGDDLNMDAGRVVEIRGNTAVVDGNEINYTAGDFRSDACLKLLDEATVVCTNPPFSLFRSYLKYLVDSGKRFLILGNQNAYTYKEVFPLLKNNLVWGGYNSGGMRFRIPDWYESKSVITENGLRYAKFGNICWFTNMDVKYRHDGLWHRNGQFDNTQAHCYYEGREAYYPKYDNYNAIEVSKTKDIPIDYSGVMGVPITFLDKYNPEEFEIVGASGYDDTPCRIARDYRALGYRFLKKDGVTVSGSGALRDKTSGKIKSKGNGDYSVSPDGECLSAVYYRMFIRNLQPISKADDTGY